MAAFAKVILLLPAQRSEPDLAQSHSISGECRLERGSDAVCVQTVGSASTPEGITLSLRVRSGMYVRETGRNGDTFSTDVKYSAFFMLIEQAVLCFNANIVACKAPGFIISAR